MADRSIHSRLTQLNTEIDDLIEHLESDTTFVGNSTQKRELVRPPSSFLTEQVDGSATTEPETGEMPAQTSGICSCVRFTGTTPSEQEDIIETIPSSRPRRSRIIIDVAGYTPGPDTTHYVVRRGPNSNILNITSNPPLKLRRTAIARVNAPPKKDLDGLSAQGLVEHIKKTWKKLKENHAVAKRLRVEEKFRRSRGQRLSEWTTKDDKVLSNMAEKGKSVEETYKCMPWHTMDDCRRRLEDHRRTSRVLIA